MIAQLKGILAFKAPSEVIVDVGGVGYQVLIPLSTYYSLPEEGGVVVLYTHTHVRDDAIQIFGFWTQLEKDLFRILIAVSKVGPKMALAILSGLEGETLCSAIAGEDVARLSGIPGVGRKTAERICMELKDKMPTAEPGAPLVEDGPISALEQCPYKDAAAALMHLGYRRAEVKDVLQGLANEAQERSVEELIRESLRYLSKA